MASGQESVSVLRGIGRVVVAAFTFLFGRPKWEAPGWLAFLGGRAAALGRWSRSHKAAALGGLVLVGALGTGGTFGVRWWKHRPKPQETTVTVSAPQPMDMDDHAKPNALLVDFDGSAAPLANIGKPVTVGIELSPKVDGAWKWANDRELEFRPKAEWPVGQEYTIRLAKKELVAPHVKLDTYKVTFSTAPFVAKLASREFNQDPVDPDLKKVVATFGFSHPVDPATFEKRVHLTLVPSSKEDAEKAYEFRVSYDKWKGRAFVHSLPVTIPQRDAKMRIVLDSGVAARAGGPAFGDKLDSDVVIPGLYNFLKVSSARPAVVDNDRMEPEEVLVLETTAGITEAELGKNLTAWVMPLYATDEEKTAKRRHTWSTELISPEDLKKAKPLKLTQIAAEREYATLHSFRYQAEVGRTVYLQVKKGMRAFGGYVLGDTWDGVVEVPPFPRQLKILQSGALISMSGEKKVSVFARDVPALKFEIGRVLPDQVHHVFSIGSGDFAHPNFYSSLGEENLAEFFSEIHPLAGAPGKPIYEALDLTKYLGGSRGLFFVKVQSWNPQGNYPLGERDARLILVSDLGVLVKDASDGSHDLFVQSIQSGDPVSGAKVSVLGKNGQPALTDTTDGGGVVHLPTFRNLQREHTPTVYMVQKGKDVSYLPVGRHDRYLDMSRFDVGGISDGSVGQKGLSAYLFSDRGLYRPGEEIRVGAIVRAKDWREKLGGIPVQVEITDARGLIVKKEQIKLSASGFEEIRHTPPEVAPTGTYTVNLYIVKDGQGGALLGSTTVKVREFLPDRMKIGVRLSAENPEGWVPPTGLKGRVNLANLFGTPAANRRVRSQLTLTPGLPSFGKLRDYHFFDPLHAKDGTSDALPDATTSVDGSAEIDLNLARFSAATYKLSLLCEGFEAEGGRSVTAEAQIYVSPLSHLIGYKADGDLNYLPKGSEHKVDFIAVGPTGAKVAVAGLKSVLIERRYVSVLMRQDNGTYKYESVRRELEVSQKPISIGDGGTKISLPTTKPGDFAIVIRDAKDIELQKVQYSVAGVGNLSRELEKNAELQVSLKKSDVSPGEELEMQIKAPFTGAGLITIEREKVFAYKWFKTSTTAAVQTIAVPPDLEGDAYVSVAFIRDPSSPEVFMSPLSYGVVPFSVSRAKRAAKVTVTTADLAKPGEPFKMKVSADRPTRMVLFAIDEGILRVADYKAPDPLAWFFQKRALGVRTAQILDLILPEFGRLMQTVAPGGDDEAAIGANLNPFKRKHQKPVTFWSGIIDVGTKEKELVYNVPDSFNGTLRIMAVAVAPDAVGTFEKKAVIRGDFVLSPNVPLAVAPGDQFDVPVAVANNVVGSGASPDIEVALTVGKELEIVGAAKQTVKIAELREGTVTFVVRATKQLGSGSLHFVASLGAKSAHLSTDTSVRPAAPYLVTFKAGHLKSGDIDVPVERHLYSEYRKLEAGISHLPLGLTHGLVGYLEKFPHGCTEQITSQAVPAIVLGKRPEFGFSAETSGAAVAQYLGLLRSRQNDDGAFGRWAANPHVDKQASVYATQVMLEAKERGIPVSADILKSALGYLQTLATDEGESIGDARLRAHAIYVMTRGGRVTSGYATALQKYLDANYPKVWRKDLTAAYLASTLSLLKQDRAARTLVDEVRLGTEKTSDLETYYDPLARDAQLLYLLARHFPERAAKVTPEELDAMVQPIFQGSYNTFSSAYTILAMEQYGRAAALSTDGAMAISEVDSGGKKPLKLTEGLLPIASYSGNAKSISFSSAGPFGAYWLVSQRGFDLDMPTKPITQKIEVLREYTDAAGKGVDKVIVGDEIFAHLKVRSLGKETINSIALVDLLPGGFEVVVQERKRASHTEDEGGNENNNEGEGGGEGEGEGDNSAGDDTSGNSRHSQSDDSDAVGSFALPISVDGTTFTPEYGDVREDRVVLYGSASPDAKEFVYVLRATNAGSYAVPPILGDSMYDRTVVARGVGSKITIIKK